MEVIVLIALAIMVSVPAAIGISEMEIKKNMNKFFLIIISTMIGLCGLVAFSYIGLTKGVKKEKHSPTKYELIQEPLYRKIK